MNDKRIAFISFHTCPLAAPGEGKVGGMNVYVRELAIHLARLGMSVDIFTRAHPGHQDECVFTEGVKVVHLDGGPTDTPVSRVFPYLRDFLKRMCEYHEERNISYKLVHSHYWLSGWIGQRFSRDHDIPHVVTFHTLSKIKRQARAGEVEPPVRARVEREILAYADMVIAFTPNEKELMQRLYGVPGGKITTIPGGVDLQLFHPVDASALRQKLALEDKRVLLFVGRLEPLKGVDLLLRTVAIMDYREKLRVLVAGGDPQGQEMARLKALARDLEIESSIIFAGRIEQKDLPYYYCAADVCVVPSYYESFGLAALEAMACGTPVVAYRAGGVSYVVQHSRTGYLVAWRCPEPFANCLESVVFNPSLKRQMGQAAVHWAKAMGWPIVASQVAEAYGLVSLEISVQPAGV